MSSTAVPSHCGTQTGPKSSPTTPIPVIPTDPYFTNLKAYTRNSQSELENLPPPTTPPRTPQKNDYDVSASNGCARNRADATKSKTKGKNRPKNTVTSPVNSRKGTPSRGMQSTSVPTSVRPASTPSTSAYAGPTFHASPAPSALPIPSFFSKSVMDSPVTKDTMILSRDDSSLSSDNSPNTAAALISSSLTELEESPLDFIFKADREEKARNNSTASTASRRNRATHFMGGPSSAMFAMELDGINSPGKPYGPAFSTPYNERINAVRPRAASSLSFQTDREQLLPKDRTDALKEYLFSGQSRSPTSCPSAPTDVFSNTLSHSHSSNAAHSQFVSNTRRANFGIYQSRQNSSPLQPAFIHEQSPKGTPRSSGLRQEIPPMITNSITREHKGYSYLTTATPPGPLHGRKTSTASMSHDNNFTSNLSTTYNSHGTDLKGMEDSLRRILKIDQVGGSGVHWDKLGNMPVGVVKVPDYVSGPQPSMNDTDHGIIGS